MNTTAMEFARNLFALRSGEIRIPYRARIAELANAYQAEAEKTKKPAPADPIKNFYYNRARLQEQAEHDRLVALANDLVRKDQEKSLKDICNAYGFSNEEYIRRIDALKKRIKDTLLGSKIEKIVDKIDGEFNAEALIKEIRKSYHEGRVPADLIRRLESLKRDYKAACEYRAQYAKCKSRNDEIVAAQKALGIHSDPEERFAEKPRGSFTQARWAEKFAIFMAHHYGMDLRYARKLVPTSDAERLNKIGSWINRHTFYDKKFDGHLVYKPVKFRVTLKPFKTPYKEREAKVLEIANALRRLSIDKRVANVSGSKNIRVRKVLKIIPNDILDVYAVRYHVAYDRDIATGTEYTMNRDAIVNEFMSVYRKYEQIYNNLFCKHSNDYAAIEHQNAEEFAIGMQFNSEDCLHKIWSIVGNGEALSIHSTAADHNMHDEINALMEAAKCADFAKKYSVKQVDDIVTRIVGTCSSAAKFGSGSDTYYLGELVEYAKQHPEDDYEDNVPRYIDTRNFEVLAAKMFADHRSDEYRVIVNAIENNDDAAIKKIKNNPEMVSLIRDMVLNECAALQMYRKTCAIIAKSCLRHLVDPHVTNGNGKKYTKRSLVEDANGVIGVIDNAILEECKAEEASDAEKHNDDSKKKKKKKDKKEPSVNTAINEYMFQMSMNIRNAIDALDGPAIYLEMAGVLFDMIRALCIIRKGVYRLMEQAEKRVDRAVHGDGNVAAADAEYKYISKYFYGITDIIGDRKMVDAWEHEDVPEGESHKLDHYGASVNDDGAVTVKAKFTAEDTTKHPAKGSLLWWYETLNQNAYEKAMAKKGNEYTSTIHDAGDLYQNACRGMTYAMNEVSNILESRNMKSCPNGWLHAEITIEVVKTFFIDIDGDLKVKEIKKSPYGIATRMVDNAVSRMRTAPVNRNSVFIDVPYTDENGNSCINRVFDGLKISYLPDGTGSDELPEETHDDYIVPAKDYERVVETDDSVSDDGVVTKESTMTFVPIVYKDKDLAMSGSGSVDPSDPIVYRMVNSAGVDIGLDDAIMLRRMFVHYEFTKAEVRAIMVRVNNKETSFLKAACGGITGSKAKTVRRDRTSSIDLKELANQIDQARQNMDSDKHNVSSNIVAGIPSSEDCGAAIGVSGDAFKKNLKSAAKKIVAISPEFKPLLDAAGKKDTEKHKILKDAPNADILRKILDLPEKSDGWPDAELVKPHDAQAKSRYGSYRRHYTGGMKDGAGSKMMRIRYGCAISDERDKVVRAIPEIGVYRNEIERPMRYFVKGYAGEVVPTEMVRGRTVYVSIKHPDVAVYCDRVTKLAKITGESDAPKIAMTHWVERDILRSKERVWAYQGKLLTIAEAWDAYKRDPDGEFVATYGFDRYDLVDVLPANMLVW